MSAVEPTLTALVDTMERLLLTPGMDGMLETCMFRFRFGQHGGRLLLRVLPTVEAAASLFAVDGHEFTAPKGHIGGRFQRASDGSMVRQSWNPPPQPDPPIQSSESLPDLGDENFIWRGYGKSTSGVIKMRVGRFLADVHAPTIDAAETLARQIAPQLR